jgi:hypothetical protein
MSTKLNKLHPSNRLFSGKVADFVHAMELYRGQMEVENELTVQLSNEQKIPLTNEDRRLMQNLSIRALKADAALRIYKRHHDDVVKNIAAELRAEKDYEFNRFADALESGDYSPLAI